MAHNGVASFRLPRLIKENYETWCQRMKILFGSQDVWEVVENDYEKSQNKEDIYLK